MRLTQVSRTGLSRVGVVLGASVLAVFAFAAPASAHVTVNPSTATQGGFAKLAFRVPNEKSAAETVALEINLPMTAPIASVSVKPVAGWTAEVTRTTLATPVHAHGRDVTEAVSKIVWTAAPGAAINPGQFQEFEISAGPLPEVDQIIFKALQTYSDGDIVRWIDEPQPGVESEHPAPVLKLTKATGDGDDSPTAEGEEAADNDDDGGSGIGIGFGIAGAVLGLAGLVVGILAYRRSAPTA
jgi:periplasmic copper chaperone A